MNKQVICFLFSIIIIGSTQAQLKFQLKGTLSGIKEPSKAMLQYRDAGKNVKDSALVTNGKFEFKGTITQPLKAKLELHSLKDNGPMTVEKMMSMDVQEFYLDGGNTFVKGTDKMQSAIIKGGKAQADYTALQKQLALQNEKMKPLSEKMQQYFKENNEAARNELFPQLRAIRVKMNQIEDNFILKNPDSYVSFDLVKNKAIVIEPKTFEPFFSALSTRFKNSKEGKSMAERLAIAKRTDIGQTAMNFSQKNVEGKSVSLTSLRGKYILLDFWASWCGPCRAENPNVLKAYNKFKDKNFDVLAVSLDENKDAWLKAIKDDGMPWIHVSDLKGFENEAAVQYGIRAIPQNFLISPDGKIVASNLRGEALDKKLTEILGDK